MNWPDITCAVNPTWPAGLPETAALPTFLGAGALLTVLTLWTYLGTRGARAGRIVLVLLLRLAALVVALLVALRPSFGMETLEGLEPSKLLIVVDSSMSMNIPDDFNSMSRWDNARRILASRTVADALKRLAADEQIEIVYYQAAETLAPWEPQGPADGKRTDIGTWLHELRAKHAGQDKLRGVLLFSDGADNGTRFPTLDEARKWRGGCPIYTFGHGKPQEDSERKDIVVAGIRAEPSPVPVKTKLTVRGLIHAPGFKDTRVKVKLFAQSSKDKEPVLWEEVEIQLKEEKNNEVVIVRDAPDTPDEYKLTLRVEPVEGEADVTNNEASTFLKVTKEGVSVLWVEGRKRPYEPIFALRALAGDKRFRAFHIEVGPGSPTGPARFGLDKRQYNVIVIGDLSAQQFDGGDKALIPMIRDLVRDKKVGLMMLGGIDTFRKGHWNETELAKVLPAKLDTEKQIDSEVQVKLPDAKLDNVDIAPFPFMMLDPNKDDNAKLWGRFKPLDGMASLGTIDKDALVLAKARDEAILVAGQYGGRVLVFGGDTTWKAWRRPQTLDAYNKFWRQALLWLANQDDHAGDLWIKLKSSRRLLAGTPDRLEFTFGLKKNGKDIVGATYQVHADGPGNQKINIAPQPGKEEQRGTLPVPSTPGEYLLRISGKGKDVNGGEVADEKAVRFLVVADNLELQRKAPDHDHLTNISDASGGKFSAPARRSCWTCSASSRGKRDRRATQRRCAGRTGIAIPFRTPGPTSSPACGDRQRCCGSSHSRRASRPNGACAGIGVWCSSCRSAIADTPQSARTFSSLSQVCPARFHVCTFLRDTPPIETPGGVLVLTNEHYSRQQPLSYHAEHLPRNVLWYADPSGAAERSELRRAGFTVREAKNALRPGIAAVNARIQSGMLLIRDGACPNLLAEAGLYRYSADPAERYAEIPVDEHNHALAALRYLIVMIDAHRLTGRRPADPAPPPPPAPAAPAEQSLAQRPQRIPVASPGLTQPKTEQESFHHENTKKGNHEKMRSTAIRSIFRPSWSFWCFHFFVLS